MKIIKVEKVKEDDKHIFFRVFDGPDEDHLAKVGELCFSSELSNVFESVLRSGGVAAQLKHDTKVVLE